MPNGNSLDAGEYWRILDAFGTTAHELLKPYQNVARARFKMLEILKMVNDETAARKLAGLEQFAEAAEKLSRSLEKQIERTIDLIPNEEWRRTLPDFGPNRDSVMAKLREDNLPFIERIFSL